MADLADMAVEIEGEHLASSLRRIDAAIPAGAPGECDDCGEDMPRLVDGRCGYCRDGRRPPLERYDCAPAPHLELAPIPARPIPPAKETTAMTSFTKGPDQQAITVPAKGELLTSIRHYADVHDLPLGRAIIAMLEARDVPGAVEIAAEAVPFDGRVGGWMQACFGLSITADKAERNHRFLEEALELVQACGCTASEAHQLVDYTFGRPVGEPYQEVGGVMVTLAALCIAHNMGLHGAAEDELARCWTNIEAIRAKQAIKPRYSPLPAAPAAPPAAAPISIEDISTDQLLAELRARFDRAADAIELAQVTARAETAEFALAQIRGLVGEAA